MSLVDDGDCRCLATGIFCRHCCGRAFLLDISTRRNRRSCSLIAPNAHIPAHMTIAATIRCSATLVSVSREFTPAVTAAAAAGARKEAISVGAEPAFLSNDHQRDICTVSQINTAQAAPT